MSVTGGHHVNDDNELSEVRESLSAEGAGLAGVHLDRPAEAVIARGQALRLRRRVLRGLSGVTAATAAAALALTLGLSGTGLTQVHVNDTDWSVNTNPDGTVVLHVRKAGDSLRLQSVLIQAGVPARVRWNENCPAPELPKLSVLVPATARQGHGLSYTWRFQPSRSHLTYVFGKLSSKNKGQGTWYVVAVPAATHVACTSRVWVIAGAGPHATPTTSPRATGTARPHPACTPRPHQTASPHGTPTPRATATASPRPAATTSPRRTATPRPSPSCTPRPRATSSPGGTPSPRESPSPHATPATSPAAG
jgi:hypothetical protein